MQIDDLMLTEEGQQELITLSNSDSKSYAGCTATTVLVTPETIYCANAGDSRTVLSRNCRAENLSVDHKPSDPIELQRIQQAGGYVENDRISGKIALSRSLGDFEHKNNAALSAKE